MRGMAVTALGAFTSVGTDVPQTMGSLLSRLQWFDDLDLVGASGEPVTGAPVRILSVDNATERLVGLAHIALSECRRQGHATRGSSESIPLLLATATADDLPCHPEELLDRVVGAGVEGAAMGEDLDRRSSRVFPGGRQGALDALAAALALLTSGRAPACYLGGVDSLLDPVRLNQLLLDERLRDGPGREGFVPGEAAVFLKLEAHSGRQALGLVLGSAIAGAERGGAVTAAPVPGFELARAGTIALQEARLDPSQLVALVHDGSGEPAQSEELAMAITRLPFQGAGRLERWAPAFSVGETGAAAAALALAMTTFFVKEGVFQGPVLVCLLSEARVRAAVVLGSSTHQGGRHG